MERKKLLEKIMRELDQDIEKYIEEHHLTHSEILYVLSELSADYEDSMFKIRHTLIKETIE